MDRLRISEFRRLLGPTSTPCVSIYLPTTPGGIDSRGDKLRLKNAIKVACAQLESLELARASIEALLAPANKLVENIDFWPNTERGLAIWLSPTEQFILKSAVAFRESISVGDSFRIRSLVQACNDEAIGYVLAISQDHVRLFRVSGQEAQVLSVPGLPSNLREALNETSVDRGAQCHTIGRGTNKKQSAVFHAQGAGHDTEKQDLSEYCREIAEVVGDYLGSTRSPLILACVEYLVPIYRDACAYPYLLPGHIEGSPDHFTNEQIAESAGPKLRSHLHTEVAIRLKRFDNLRSTKRASTDVCQIVRAACDGQVDELFFDDSRDVWGRFEPAEGIVDVHDIAATTDDELIEVAVEATLRHRGNVHAIAAGQLPSPSPLAAIFRNVPALNEVAIHSQA
jgi:hypothetical protein